MKNFLKPKSEKTKFSDYEIIEAPEISEYEYVVPVGMVKTDIGNLYLVKFVMLGDTTNYLYISHINIIYEKQSIKNKKIIFTNDELVDNFGYNGRFFYSFYWAECNKKRDNPVLIKTRPCSNWIEREIVRVVYGEYNLLDSNIVVYPPEHFPYIITKNKELFVSFIPDDKYGNADRRVEMKIGRYLTKYTAYSNEEIKSLIRKMELQYFEDKEFKLHFTEDLKKIREIFEIPMYVQDSKSVSCMYGKFTEWNFRPYDIYANNPTMCVAYMTYKDRIVARSVINVPENGYIRTYAIKENNSLLHTKFIKLLKEEGYEKTNLEGCCFHARYNEYGSLIAPYIDGNANKGLRMTKEKIMIVNNNHDYYDYEFISVDGFVNCRNDYDDSDDNNK